MLGEITNEIREALTKFNQWPEGSYAKKVIRAFRDQLAANIRAEFWGEHDESTIYLEDCTPDGVYCRECGRIELDPRHNYDDSAWLAEAERVLTKGD